MRASGRVSLIAALQAGVIVADDQLHAVQAALLQAAPGNPSSWLALAVGQLDREHVAATVPVDTEAISTAWLWMTPFSRTRS